MPRGGYREKAGRKPGWNHTETQVIRVPKAIAPQLLEIAKKLDKGEPIECVAESIGQGHDPEEVLMDSVTESIRQLVSRWQGRDNSILRKNSRLDKARDLLVELDVVLNREPSLESATNSKDVSGQMSLLDLEDNSVDFVFLEESFNANDLAQPSRLLEEFSLNLTELGERWKQTLPSISRAKKIKTREEFIEFSREKENEKGYNFGWEYLPKIKRFRPVDIEPSLLWELVTLYRGNPVAAQRSERSGEG